MRRVFAFDGGLSNLPPRIRPELPAQGREDNKRQPPAQPAGQGAGKGKGKKP